jgi:hypothetical protein
MAALTGLLERGFDRPAGAARAAAGDKHPASGTPTLPSSLLSPGAGLPGEAGEQGTGLPGRAYRPLTGATGGGGAARPDRAGVSRDKQRGEQPGEQDEHGRTSRPNASGRRWPQRSPLGQPQLPRLATERWGHCSDPVLYHSGNRGPELLKPHVAAGPAAATAAGQGSFRLACVTNFHPPQARPAVFVELTISFHDF